MSSDRRRFLGGLLYGGSILALPAFVGACSSTRQKAVSQPIPQNPFSDWFAIDEAEISRLLSLLTENGADFADIYFQSLATSTMVLRDENPDPAKSTVSLGAGFRVVQDGRTGFAWTESLEIGSLEKTARMAAANVQGEAVLPAQATGWAAPGTAYVTNDDWSGVGVDFRRKLLLAAHQSAKRRDATLSEVVVSLSDADERVLIATADGRRVTDYRPMTRMSVQVTAERNARQESGFASVSARADASFYSELSVRELAEQAVDQADALFEARRSPAGEMPVILAAGGSGVLLHEAIGHSFEADFNRAGVSPLSGSIGSAVASPAVSIVDQGDVPNARGALNYDDEGLACSQTVLVEKGVARNFLHDRQTAAHYGVEPTASARRQSFRHLPMPRMTCTSMLPGNYAPEDLAESIEFGVLADGLATGRVKLGEGSFRFRVRQGWLIEKGRRTVPLKDFELLGNGPELLRSIDMVANDFMWDQAGWTCGKNGQTVPVSQGMPSVRVPALAVSPLGA